MIQMELSFIISPKMLHGLTSSNFCLNQKPLEGMLKKAPFFFVVGGPAISKKMGRLPAPPILHVGH